MTVSIPNDASATFSDEALPDSVDFDILSGLSGVLSGCGVTANGINMTLTVAAGVAVVNGQPVNVAGGTVVIGAASANPRWDIVVINSAGAQSAITGQPSTTNAVLPIVDTSLFAALRAVYIPTSTSALTSGHLIDKSKPIMSSIERILAATGTTFLRSRVTTDTTDRLKVTADGKIVWTPGNSGTPAPQLAFDATLAGLLHTGKFGVVPSAVGETPLTVTAAGGQTADLFQVRNSTPTVLVRVNATGQLTAPNIQRGAGAPNGAVVGSVGDMYQQTDGANGATLWIKESGNVTNTGWNASGTTSAGLVLGGGQIATGCILEYPAGALPGGFLFCDGSEASRTTFSALFALWGTTFGQGNGVSTFNLIDKRGIITAGAQNFGFNGTVGFSDRQIGTVVGTTAGSRNKQLSGVELPPHNHPGSTDLGHNHPSNKRPNTGTVPINAGSGPLEVETINGAAGFGNTGNGNAQLSIAVDGIGAAFSLLQPTQLSRYIVKY